MKNLGKMEELKEKLEIARETGDKAGEAEALYGIGRIYSRENVTEAAEDYWRQCELLCRECRMEGELGQVLIDLGDLSRDNGDSEKAGAVYREAMNVFRIMGNPQGEAKALERLSALIFHQGDTEQALTLLNQGLDICRKNEDRIGALYFLERCIELKRELEAFGEAEPYYRDLITLAEKIGDRDRMALGLAGLADIQEKKGAPAEAAPYLTLAHDIYIHLGKPAEAELVRRDLTRILGRDPLSGQGPA
jgi:tetratricopeptide (TPR) repeat protein